MFMAVCGAVVAGGCTGGLVRRWADGYAELLDAGAAATARTLWRAWAQAWRRPWSLARDGAAALLLGVMAGWLVVRGGLACVPLALTLAALAWLDSRSGLLPDALTLPLMGAGWVLGMQTVGVAVGVSVLVWAGLAAMAGVYRRLRGHDGFGGGDVKCLAALAGWLGPEAAACILWLACVLGVAACAGRRDGWRRPYPFGPCIAAAAWGWMLVPPSAWLAVQSWF